MDARKLTAGLSIKNIIVAFAAVSLPAIITPIDEKMSDTVTELKSVIDSLRKEIKSKNIVIDNLVIDNLVAQNDSLRYQPDALETYSGRQPDYQRFTWNCGDNHTIGEFWFEVNLKQYSEWSTSFMQWLPEN